MRRSLDPNAKLSGDEFRNGVKPRLRNTEKAYWGQKWYSSTIYVHNRTAPVLAHYAWVSYKWPLDFTWS